MWAHVQARHRDGLPVVRIASTIPMEGKLGPSFIVIIDLIGSCDNVICACTLHDLVQSSYCCKNTSDVYKTKSMPCVVVVVDDMTRMQRQQPWGQIERINHIYNGRHEPSPDTFMSKRGFLPLCHYLLASLTYQA